MNERTEQIQQRYDAAMAMVSALCKPRGTAGSREWLMHIPAQPDDDPDLVIGHSLSDVPKLLAEVAALGERLRYAQADRDHLLERLRAAEAQQARLRAAGWAFVCDTPDSSYRRAFWAVLEENDRAALAGTGAATQATECEHEWVTHAPMGNYADTRCKRCGAQSL